MKLARRHFLAALGAAGVAPSILPPGRGTWEPPPVMRVS